MTWLAKTQLDYKTIWSGQTPSQLQIRDCYEWHQRVWDFFPGRPKRSPLPALFRVIPKDQTCDLWLLCREEPSKPEWLISGTCAWQIKVIGNGFPFHQRYRFDLMANPTQRDKTRDCWNGRERIRKKHRRFNLKTIEEQRQWIMRKSEEHGFRLLGKTEGATLDINPRSDFRFKYKDGARGTHVGVRYEGVLEVTDREKFLTGFKKGLGSAKSFGFGLLLLTPVNL